MVIAALVVLGLAVAGIVVYLVWDWRESKHAGQLVASMFNVLSAPPAWPQRPSVHRTLVHRTLRRQAGPLNFRRVRPDR